jgi:hypothetical protein
VTKLLTQYVCSVKPTYRIKLIAMELFHLVYLSKNIKKLKFYFFTILLFCISNKSFSATYYVNDGNTIGDFYCTAVGNNSNNGLSPSTPKATLTNLFTTYTGILTSGDIIRIDAGTYNDVNLVLNIAGISITGTGPAKTIFDNAGASADANRLFDITANNITIQEIYIKGYNRGTGGASAIQVSGVSGVNFNNVLTDENRPGGGSATIVINGGSTVTFNGGGSNCNSTGSVAGGGVNVEGNGNNVTFNSYSFSNNSKDFQGGSGLYVSGNNTTNVTVNNSIFADNRNTSADGGGAIFISGSNLTINGSCFLNNSSFKTGGPNYGGAISVGRGATLTIANCTFTNNAVSNSGNGGAISINTSFAGSGGTATVNLTTCSFTNNSSSSSGNHIYARVGFSNQAIFNINECTFSATAQAIRNDNTATINLQNSGNPSKSGTINTINTTAPTTSAVTNYPVLQGSCYGTVLPVELIDFTGNCKDSHTNLSWSTASEHNNNYFTISRADSDFEFNVITTISGQNTTTVKTDYSYEDFQALAGTNYYRISQTDFDGTEKLLKTISVDNSCSTRGGQEINSSFNIENQSITIGYFFDENQTMIAEIYNSMGQIVQRTEVLLSANNRKIELKLNDAYSTGVYFLKLTNDFVLYSDKFIVNK